MAKNVKEVKVVIEGESWQKALEKAFKEKVKTVAVDGFRKGKVPRDIYEKKYGKESLYIPASDFVIEEAYRKALDDSKLVPVVQPKLNIKSVDDSKIEFVFTITEKPEVKINKYKGLGVKREKAVVTKEEIDHELSHMLEKYVDIRTKEEGTLENGDIAVIDFEGFKDSIAFDGGKANDYELEIGSNTFIPGFEEKVIGMTVGSERDIELKFPKDYPSEDLKGQKVVFKVKLNAIKQKVTREFDKELFDDLAIEGVNSKKELDSYVENHLKEHKEMDIENKHVDKLLEKILENTEMDIPEEMIEDEVTRLIKRYEEQLRSQGISLEMYYEFTKSSEKDLRKNMDVEASKHVSFRLILEELLKLEKVTVEDKEVALEVDKLAERYNVTKEELLNSFGDEDMIKYDLEMRKLIELLKEYNK